MNTNIKGLLRGLLLVGAFVVLSVLPANALILQWNLTYYAGDHGVIVGDGSQIVLDGNDGTPVGVTADPDYWFYQWSDGNTDNPRTDLAVTEDITVTAEYLPNVPSIVYVDDDYTDIGANDGHLWGYDAFDNIPEALLNVGPDATINVADGTYESTNTIEITTPGITISGPTPVDMEALPLVRNYDCAKVFNILANDVSIIGFEIKQTDAMYDYCYSNPIIRVGEYTGTNIESNRISGGRVGIANYYEGGDSTITNNVISDNDTYGIVIWQGAHIITGNEIYSNGSGIGMGCGADSCGNDYDLSGTSISDNAIYSNGEAGIIFSAGDQIDTVAIGPNNDIYDNFENVWINTNAGNLEINGNKIHDSINISTGLHVEIGNNTGLINATNNWWGDASGPYIDGIFPGAGDNITTPDEDTMIFFRPYCITDDCSEFSSLETTPENLEDNFITGTFSIDGSDYTDTSKIIVTEDITITVDGAIGTSTIFIPTGTEITNSSGDNIDGSLLTAAELDPDSISGLATGDVVYGALQWGIESLGLLFSQPITISLYVGADLYNQTLEIKRSVDGVTWTSTGIVSPATCVVDADGMCTFQATKASSYTGYDEYEMEESSHGNTGSISLTYNNPTPTGDGETSQTVGMGQTVSVGNLSTEGLNLFTYVDSVAHFKALHSSTYTYEEHTMTITGLDMAQQIVSFKIESDPQYFSLKLGEEVQVDLDKDSIKDIKVKFSNLTVNRIEMTLKSLLTKTGTTNTDGTQTQTENKLCAYSFTRDLTIGMNGADVKELQKCLNSIGYTLATTGAASPGWETSFFGTLTKAGLTRFQTANGLSASGKLDAATRAKLNGVATPSVTPAGKYMFTRNLSLGMSGDDVKELQKYLNTHGYVIATSGAGSIGNETIYYGYATRAAVMKLQSANGISPVGYVGALTRAVLNK